MFQIRTKPKPADTLEVRARTAVNRCDLEECRRLLEIARAMPVEDAAPLFIAFFYGPHRKFAAKKWLRSEAVAFRRDVLRYMEHVGPPHCIEPLIEAMGLAPLSIAQEACETLIKIGDPALPNLIACIGEPNGILYRKPLKAIEAMATIGGREVSIALAGMLSRQRPRRTAHCPSMIWLIVMGSFPATIFFLLRNVISPNHAMRMFLIWAFISCSSLRFESDKRWLKGEEELDKAACFALVEIGDTAAIPELISAAIIARAPSTRKLASGALLKLFPLLNSSHAPELTSAQERSLTDLVDRYMHVGFALKDKSLTLAAIKSLEYIGTGQSAAYIEKITRGWDSSNYTFVRTSVMEEALRVLPILQERKRREEQMAVLLRPAEPASQELLLRPAAEVKVDAEIEREQLLRPGE